MAFAEPHSPHRTSRPTFDTLVFKRARGRSAHERADGSQDSRVLRNLIYLTVIFVVAVLVLPAAVVHLRSIVESEVIGPVDAIPFTLVFAAFFAVKSGKSGDETMQDFIPVVTHPTDAASPDATDCGFAMSTIDVFETCTLHCALLVFFSAFAHVSW